MHKQIVNKDHRFGCKIACHLIRGYRFFLAPFFGGQCRFYPTCSHFTEQAIKTHGLTKGVILGCCRLMRCHPFHPGGYDPVPGNFLNLRKK